MRCCTVDWGLHQFRSFLMLFFAKTDKINTENKKNGIFLKLLVSEQKQKTVRAGGGTGGGWGADVVDGGDERCVVEGDSIRGVKANRTKQRGHRCAACSPVYRQAAAQTALSAQHAYHTAVCPAGLSLTGLLHPPGSTARARGGKKTTKRCCEVLHVDNDTLQHREKMWRCFFHWHWNVCVFAL